jgi:hypothetical protein
LHSNQTIARDANISHGRHIQFGHVFAIVEKVLTIVEFHGQFARHEEIIEQQFVEIEQHGESRRHRSAQCDSIRQSALVDDSGRIY